MVARGQLRTLGLSAHAIDARVRRGLLRPVHHGVYAVGHDAISDHGARHAALLRAGPTAVLSHRSAARALGIIAAPRPGAGDPVHVTVPGGCRRSAPGLIVHRARLLAPQDVTRRHGMPMTAAARTLLDLATTASRGTLARAAREAEFLRLTDDAQIEAAIARAHGHRGTPRLRAALGLRATRSDLEIRMLALCATHGIPTPQVNTRVCGHEVDFCWPAAGVVAEADGGQAHRTRYAFEQDRVRDADLTVAGWRVVRFTHDRITQRPDAVAATLRTLLGA